MATLLRGTALITGAGSGIGQYAAYAFARYGVKKLAITDIKPENLQSTVDGLKKQAPSVEVEPIQMDCTSETDINKTIDHVVKKFGRLDIAVNNAGTGGPLVETTKVELSEWQKLMDLNVNGVWLCERAELRQMLKQEYVPHSCPYPEFASLTNCSVLDEREGRGVIVNIASMYGIVGNTPTIPAAAYSTSKHAVVGLTKTDALYYAKHKIRINAMCPGYTETPLLQQAIKEGHMKGEVEKTPMGRLGKMEEIGDSITFLASPMSSFMTGASLIVDGGFTAQ